MPLPRADGLPDQAEGASRVVVTPSLTTSHPARSRPILASLQLAQLRADHINLALELLGSLYRIIAAAQEVRS